MDKKDYFNLYIKYKKKYLNLKKQVGGFDKNDEMKLNSLLLGLENNLKEIRTTKRNTKKRYIIRGLIDNCIFILKLINIIYKKSVKTGHNNIVLRIISDRLTSNIEETNDIVSQQYGNNVFQPVRSYIEENFNFDIDNSSAIHQAKKLEKILDEREIQRIEQLKFNFGIDNTGHKNCTPHEILLENKNDCTLNSQMHVVGSCGIDLHGDIRVLKVKDNNYSSVSSILLEQFNNLFTKLDTVDGKIGLYIILGGSGQKNFDELIEIYSNDGNNINIELNIKPGNNISDISGESINSDKSFMINSEFPLNVNDEMSKNLCNLLIDKSKLEKYNIYLINNMCGSCQPSFYYLINKRESLINYRVQPTQNLTLEDNANVKRCFKN